MISLILNKTQFLFNQLRRKLHANRRGVQKSKEKLTVLIPNFNKAKYIAKALESVLMQRTSFPFIVLIIDDASTDESVKIIEKFANKYPEKIKFLKNKKNLGYLAATLKGYGKIKTEYFCVLDPDDYWIKKDKLQKAVDFLDKNNDFTIYVANNYVQHDAKSMVTYFQQKSTDFDFNDLDKMVSGHTSATIFRNVVFIDEIPKTAQAAIGTKYEKVYAGDTFRNMIHLKEGKGHYENSLESVYRITNDGVWTSMTVFQQNILNAQIFLKLFLYFNEVHPEFFIRQYWFYCQKNLDLLNDGANKKLVDSIKKEEMDEWRKILSECIEHKNKHINNLHKSNKKSSRTETRIRLMFYSILMFINQIPIINKPLMSRTEIFDKMREAIENEESPQIKL